MNVTRLAFGMMRTLAELVFVLAGIRLLVVSEGILATPFAFGVIFAGIFFGVISYESKSLAQTLAFAASVPASLAVAELFGLTPVRTTVGVTALYLGAFSTGYSAHKRYTNG